MKKEKKSKYIALEFLGIFIFSCVVILLMKNFIMQTTDSLSIQNSYYNSLHAPEQNGYFTLTKKHNDIIVILAEDSISKEKIASLLEKIQSLNPAVLAIDILFSEDKKQIQDSVLIQQINKSNNIVLAYRKKTSTIELSYFLKDINDIPMGYVHPYKTEDGYDRFFTPIETKKNQTYKHFALVAAENYLNVDLLPYIDSHSIDFSHDIRTLPAHRVGIDYKDDIENKIVILGLKSSDDIRNIPISKVSYGAELHGYILATILNQYNNPRIFWHKWLLIIFLIIVTLVIYTFIRYVFLKYRVDFLESIFILILNIIWLYICVHLISNLDFYAMQIMLSPSLTSIIVYAWSKIVSIYYRARKRLPLCFWAAQYSLYNRT